MENTPIRNKNYSDNPKHMLKRQNRPTKCNKDTQQPPLLSLLQRNRSLQMLFDCNRPFQKNSKPIREVQKHCSPKYQLLGQGGARDKEGNKQQHQLKILIRDDYLLGRGSNQHNKGKGEHLQPENRRKEYLKINVNQTEGKQNKPLLGNNGSNYDPRNYDWRKSLSKSKEKYTSARSPRPVPTPTHSVKITESQYYPGTRKNSEQEGHLLQTRRAKCKTIASVGHSRSQSALSKPMVIRNIFEPQTPKPKRGAFSSSKSMFFTFGL